MEYEIQYAKIATSERLTDRFLNCQEKSSNDLAKSYMGKVYTLVEIMSPWFPTSQVGQSIISTFTQAYYQGGSTSDMVNFEEALKKVNENLAQITQNGETSWIGNLNSILAVVVENKLHIAQTGKTEAYIFRDGKTNHITYGLAQSQLEPHPLKTYSNIISGEIKPHDKVLIVNSEIFKHIDLESLRQIIALNSPQEAILQIAKILRKKKIKTVNALILNLASREELSHQTLNETQSMIQLDRPMESIFATVKRLYLQIVHPLVLIAGKKTKKAGAKSLTFTKQYVSLLQNRTNNEPIKKRDIFEKEFIEDNKIEEGLLKDEEIQYSPELNVHYYEQSKNEQKKNNSLSNKILRTVLPIIASAFAFIKQLAKNQKTKPYFYVVSAIIIVIIIGLIVNARHNGNKDQLNLLQAQNVLKEAESFQKDAKSALLSSENDKAKDLFVQAIDKAESIKSNPVVKQDALSVIDKSYEELDKLTNTTRYDSLDAIVTNSQDVKSIFVASGRAYFVGNNDIYRANLNGGRVEKIGSLPKNSGDFQFGTLYGDKIFLYTSSQKTFTLNTNTEKISPNTLDSGNWETANNAFFYSGNIYLLDGIIGQIYRHASSSDSFDAGQAYIQSEAIDVKNSRSLAIDGNVYVLQNNGEVLALQKGRLQDFSLKDIPSPWSSIDEPLKIFTDSDTPSIYILDNSKKRVLSFDKNGRFIHQYALPKSIDNIKDFVVSIKSKKIWILGGNNLYEITI